MSERGALANPYMPPVEVREAKAGDAGRREVKRAVFTFLASILLILATGVVGFAGASNWVLTIGCGAAALVALTGCGLGIASLVQSLRAAKPFTETFGLAAIIAILANGFMSLVGALFALLSTAQFTRGRQLRRFGRVVLPKMTSSRDWTEVPFATLANDANARLRGALAAQWRENGRTEHASVGAFARLTLDLMGLGAPPSLVAAANRDALDEIRHAELCFSLARALDGKSEGPGAFPEASRARTLPAHRTFALGVLAVDSLIDGALHEGVSARVIAKLAKRCEEPAIRALLKEIAADEGRHSAHGWDVVEWCVAEGGSAVADALRGALVALPRTMRSPLPEAAHGGEWERFGIHGHALEAEEFAATRADLVRRMLRLLGDAQPAAA